MSKQNPVFPGEVWGNLTLTGRRRYRKDQGKTVVECVCSCGHIGWHVLTSIRLGKIKSCGCIRKAQWLAEVSRTGNTCPAWGGCGEISRHVWNLIRDNALKRGLTFTMTIEEGWGLFLNQNRRCALTGVLLVFAPSVRTYSIKTASLDRIDPAKGYSPDNVQWVHKEINLMRRDLSVKAFVDWCRQVVQTAETV
jgi:hypothetical protein